VPSWKSSLPEILYVFVNKTTDNTENSWQYISPEVDGTGNLTISFIGLDSYSFVKATQVDRTFILKVGFDLLKPKDA